MINLHIAITNPHNNRYSHVISKAGGTPFTNQYWEFEVIRTNEIVSLLFCVTTRCSHSGFEIGLEFLGYGIRLQWYDNRHWDYKEKRHV